MDRFSQLELRSLIEQPTGRSVSVYLPTHRVKEEAQQDPIRLKNLLRHVERKLAEEGRDPTTIEETVEPALSLLEDRSFWQQQQDGLALFLRQGFMRCYRLPVRFVEQVVVADHFSLQPLFPLLTGDGEFHLLTLSGKAPRLFRGSRFRFEEVGMRNAPAGLAEVTQYVERQKSLQVYNSGGHGLYYGHGDAGEIKRSTLLEYFRQVNRSLRETLVDERAPLVLAGLESHFPVYREVNTYPSLLGEGVGGNPDDAPIEDLHHQAWELVSPHFRRGLEEALAGYQRLAGAGRGRTADSIAAILPAACQGRVETLFIPAGVSLWGRFDSDTGAVEMTDGPDSDSEDLVNLAAIYAYLQKGAVYAVRPAWVPGSGNIAAVMRY